MSNSFLQQLANANYLSLDPQSDLLYGELNGFQLILRPLDNGNQFLLRASVCKNGQAASSADIEQLSSRSTVLTHGRVSGFCIDFYIPGGSSRKKVANNVRQAISELLIFLQEGTYQNCCQHCGAPGSVSFCHVGNAGSILCSSCFYDHYAASDSQQMPTKQGHPLSGTVGALLGSLIGGACIVLLGQLGYVAAISGILMAVCTVKGYELLSGGKVGRCGIIISCLVMVLMAAFAHQIDWAISVSSAFSISFFDAFQLIPSLIADGYIVSSSFFGNLALLYLFTALGAVPTIISTTKNAKLSQSCYIIQ